jgi:hypothetical protein
MYADLHLHTTASDGLLKPRQVVRIAEAKGFSAIAITDHDTVDGLEEAIKEGNIRGIEVIPGIELSTLCGQKEVHVLGYCIDRESSKLHKILKQFIESRKIRAVKMVEKLNELGIRISMKRVREMAEGEFVGRSHIARAMVEKGYISEISRAFTREYIGNGGKAYVERFKLNTREAIELILDINGIPVLAHPGLESNGEALYEDEIKEFVEYGLKGIEVYYSEHDELQTRYYEDIANRYSLLITGGSDCHGDRDEGLLLGKIKLPYRYVEALKKERESLKKLRQILKD